MFWGSLHPSRSHQFLLCCCDETPRLKGTRGKKFVLVYVPEGKPMVAVGQRRKQQAGRQEQKAERPYLNLKQEAEGELELE